MGSYLSHIKRYGWIALACVLLATCVGFGVARAQPTVYQAPSVLLVQVGAPGTTYPGGPSAGGTSADSLGEALNYAVEIPTRSIMTYIIKAVPELQQHHFTVDNLITDVAPSTSTTAATITLLATATHPDDATLIANDVANGFVSYSQARSQQQLDALRKNLTTQIAAVQQQKSAWEARISTLPNTAVPQYTVYNNNLTDTTRTLDTLQSQLMALPTTVNGDVSVIQAAAPRDVTTTPRGTIIVAVTAGVGLLVGILVMLLVIFLDRRLLSDEEVREKLGLAYLGSLSNRSNIKEIRELPKNEVLRELSDIWTNLRLTGVLPGSWQPPQAGVLLITSPREAEGKTTLAVALSAAAALGGCSVAVVDGNLRHPSTHLAYRINSSRFGLSGLLKGTGNIDDAIERTSVPGIWLLPGGAPLDNAALLMEQKLPEILIRLRNKVSLVIIDGPSLLSSADACLLASMADGVALVVDVRHEKLPLLLRSRELLDTLTHTPTGIIMNRLSSRSSNRYYAAPYPGNAPSENRAMVRGSAHRSNGQVDPQAAMSMVNGPSPAPTGAGVPPDPLLSPSSIPAPGVVPSESGFTGMSQMPKASGGSLFSLGRPSKTPAPEEVNPQQQRNQEEFYADRRYLS